MGEHESPKPPFIPDAYRLWLYVVSAAILVCLAAWGIIDGDKIAALNFLFAAIFGVAANNVPQRKAS
nr:MAG TPA: Mycobacterial 2 TMS Phage Holin (M2 Hol) Family [Caudoviricetes sp.]